MRCPNCGRFCKVKISEDDEKIQVYADCSHCGIIDLEKKEVDKVAEERKEVGEVAEETTDYVKMLLGGDNVKMFLAVFTVILICTSAFLYLKVNEGNNTIAYANSIIEEMGYGYQQLNNSYYDLEGNYLLLLNTSSSLEDYYSELQGMYSTLRDEYDNLEDMYSVLALEKAELQDDYSELKGIKDSIQGELDDILSFVKATYLEQNVSYELPAGGNMTLSYNITYAGYIEVEFNSTTDIYFWVGSSVSENGYYARYPSFSNTAYNGTITIPVCAHVYLFIVNANVDAGAIVTLTIEYIY